MKNIISPKVRDSSTQVRMCGVHVCISRTPIVTSRRFVQYYIELTYCKFVLSISVGGGITATVVNLHIQKHHCTKIFFCNTCLATIGGAIKIRYYRFTVDFNRIIKISKSHLEVIWFQTITIILHMRIDAFALPNT